MSSDSSDEEFLYNAVGYVLRAERQIVIRRHPLEMYSDNEFKIRYRFSKPVFQEIVNLIRPALESNTHRGIPVSPEDQVLIATRFYATGSFQKLIGDYINVSTATVCRIIQRVSEQLAGLREDIIDMPKDENLARCKHDFFEIAQFPGVIACIDCTHIRIQSPRGLDGEIYRNRKGYFSLNVQAVCDAKLSIRNIVARWPGSVHDSTIFNDSALKLQLEEGEFGSGYLLGDNGYSCRKYLLTPILNPQTAPEIAYNHAQIRTRNTVERMFGLWKRRFPSLSIGLRTNITKTLTIIVATAVLHNISIDLNDEVPDRIDLNNADMRIAANIDDPVPVPLMANIPRNDSVRSNLINTYFNRLI